MALLIPATVSAREIPPPKESAAATDLQFREDLRNAGGEDPAKQELPVR
jgi:hypothetical protein